MHPVLALALVAAAGVAAARLPLGGTSATAWPLVAAARTPLVVLGVLLGPAIGLLDAPARRGLAPLLALAIGWTGASLGARLPWRVLRRVPRRWWMLAGAQAAAVGAAVAALAWTLTAALPALRAGWGPTIPAALTLGAIAVVSAPGLVALAAREAGIGRRDARRLDTAAAVDTGIGALAAALVLGTWHGGPPAGAAGGVLWLGAALGSGALLGVLGAALMKVYPEDAAVALAGIVLLGAGAGLAAGFAPFVVCAVAAAFAVSRSSRRRDLDRRLRAWAPPAEAVLLILAGALLALPTGWILPAAVLLAGLRSAIRLAAAGPGARVVRAAAPGAPWAGLAQGATAIALGAQFFMLRGDLDARNAAPGAVLTTVVVSVACAQLLVPVALRRARRPRVLTPATTAAEVT